jgi:hypothetical protein
MLQECPLCLCKETEKKSTFFLRKVRYAFRSLSNGVLAQLVERLNGIEEVRGSNPLGSRLRPVALGSGRLRLAGQTSPRPMTFEFHIKARSLSDEASSSIKRQGVVGLSLLPRDSACSLYARRGYIWQSLPLGRDSGRLRLGTG